MDELPPEASRRGVAARYITGVIKLEGSDDRDRRLFAGPVRWYTDDPDLLWLNDRWGYEEGQLDLDTLGFRTTAHAIHPEPPEERT
jgi:hypothetical protein